MNETKAWYTSKTLHGIIVAAVSLVVMARKIDFAQADIETTVASVLASVGLLYAFVGRVVAKDRIGGSDPTPPAAASIVLLALLALPLAGGCDTSRPFQLGANRVGLRLVKNAGAYLAKDATIAAEVRSDRQTRIAALKAAVVTPDAVTYEAVAITWHPVRVFYLPYIDSDPRFCDGKAPDIKASKLFTAGAMDRLIEAERARRAVLGLFGDEAVQKAAAAATQPAQ